MCKYQQQKATDNHHLTAPEQSQQNRAPEASKQHCQHNQDCWLEAEEVSPAHTQVTDNRWRDLESGTRRHMYECMEEGSHGWSVVHGHARRQADWQTSLRMKTAGKQRAVSATSHMGGRRGDGRTNRGWIQGRKDCGWIRYPNPNPWFWYHVTNLGDLRR